MMSQGDFFLGTVPVSWFPAARFAEKSRLHSLIWKSNRVQVCRSRKGRRSAMRSGSALLFGELLTREPSWSGYRAGC